MHLASRFAAVATVAFIFTIMDSPADAASGPCAVLLVRRGRRAGRGHVARHPDARPRDRGLQHDYARYLRERAQAGPPADSVRCLLESAQQLESRHGILVFGVDRKTVRRTPGSGTVLEGLA